MTPGQRALHDAIELRTDELRQEYGAMYFLTDWIVLMAGQEMNVDKTTFLFAETSGPGEVSVHTELGMLEHSLTRLRARLAARWGRGNQ